MNQSVTSVRGSSSDHIQHPALSTPTRTASGPRPLQPPATPSAPPSLSTTWRARSSPRSSYPPSDPRTGTRSALRNPVLALLELSSSHQVLMRDIRENPFLVQVIEMAWDHSVVPQDPRFYLPRPLLPFNTLNPSKHSRHLENFLRYQRMLSS